MILIALDRGIHRAAFNSFSVTGYPLSFLQQIADEASVSGTSQQPLRVRIADRFLSRIRPWSS